MLVVDLRSSLAYFMMTHPLPVASKLSVKTLVAKQLPTNTHTYTHMYTHTHTHTHVHNVHTHTHTLTHSHTHTHTHTHTLAHTNTQTHTCKHMHMHTYINFACNCAQGMIITWGHNNCIVLHTYTTVLQCIYRSVLGKCPLLGKRPCNYFGCSNKKRPLPGKRTCNVSQDNIASAHQN